MASEAFDPFADDDEDVGVVAATPPRHSSASSPSPRGSRAIAASPRDSAPVMATSPRGSVSSYDKNHDGAAIAREFAAAFEGGGGGFDDFPSNCFPAEFEHVDDDDEEGE